MRIPYIAAVAIAVSSTTMVGSAFAQEAVKTRAEVKAETLAAFCTGDIVYGFDFEGKKLNELHPGVYPRKDAKCAQVLAARDEAKARASDVARQGSPTSVR